MKKIWNWIMSLFGRRPAPFPRLLHAGLNGAHGWRVPDGIEITLTPEMFDSQPAEPVFSMGSNIQQIVDAMPKPELKQKEDSDHRCRERMLLPAPPMPPTPPAPLVIEPERSGPKEKYTRAAPDDLQKSYEENQRIPPCWPGCQQHRDRLMRMVLVLVYLSEQPMNHLELCIRMLDLPAGTKRHPVYNGKRCSDVFHNYTRDLYMRELVEREDLMKTNRHHLRWSLTNRALGKRPLELVKSHFDCDFNDEEINYLINHGMPTWMHGAALSRPVMIEGGA